MLDPTYVRRQSLALPRPIWHLHQVPVGTAARTWCGRILEGPLSFSEVRPQPFKRATDGVAPPVCRSCQRAYNRALEDSANG